MSRGRSCRTGGLKLVFNFNDAKFVIVGLAGHCEAVLHDETIKAAKI